MKQAAVYEYFKLRRLLDLKSVLKIVCWAGIHFMKIVKFEFDVENLHCFRLYRSFVNSRSVLRNLFVSRF